VRRSDESLRQRVYQSWQRNEIEDVPPFDDVWQRAEGRFATSRRQYGRVAAVVLALGVIAAVFGVRPAVEEPTYIEMAELLNSTYWAAPSDVLLPQREFDIYQDLPALFEST
jgi:hypothetical protein